MSGISNAIYRVNKCRKRDLYAANSLSRMLTNLIYTQIIGDENVARKALLEVLSRLRCNVFGMELDEFLESGGAVGPPFTGMGMNEGFGGPPFARPGVNEGFGGPPFARPGMNEGFGGPPPTLGTRHDAGFPAALPSNVGIRHEMGYRGSMHSFNGYGLQGGQYESNLALPPVSPLQVFNVALPPFCL